MGSIAAAVLAAWLLHSSKPELPVEPPKPKPAKPKRTLDPEPLVYTCILDDPLPPPPLMRGCEPRRPEIDGVVFLRDCPEWIDRMVAEADRLP